MQVINKSAKVILALGSNVGNRLENLSNAINYIKAAGIRVLKSSIVIENKALLKEGSPQSWNLPYYNMALFAETDYTPEELLLHIKNIEKQMGRINIQQWAPRNIDIDIIFYEDFIIDTPSLTIPHKEALNRSFVLLPIYNICPKFIHPIVNKSIEEIIGNFANYKEQFMKSLTIEPKVMGILNVTKDSFSDGNKFYSIDKAIEHAYKLIDDGAYILDIGAQSTNPASTLLSYQDELDKLIPILNALEGVSQYVKISIDTFRPEVLERLLNRFKIDIINDVNAARDKRLLEIARESNTEYVLMHSLEAPTRGKNLISFKEDAFAQIYKWAHQKIKELQEFGLKNIIFDPGIGFGISPSQSISLISNTFKDLPCKILLGHSRKSFMNAFCAYEAASRDLETATIAALVKDKVDYLRVHDVKSTCRALCAASIL